MTRQEAEALALQQAEGPDLARTVRAELSRTPLSELLEAAAPSLSTSGETLTIEESMTLRARTENAGHVEVEHGWSCG